MNSLYSTDWFSTSAGPRFDADQTLPIGLSKTQAAKKMKNAESQLSMTGSARTLARKVLASSKRVLFPPKSYVMHKGVVLPPPGIRFNGPDQQNNETLLDSAIREAERVATKLAYTPDQLLVDVGCGQGRLAIGLALRHGNARYLGLDVSEASIRWCNAHITQRYPSYRFNYVDVVNARYNPAGPELRREFHLPVPDGAADIVYLWGVVTNMEPDHLPIYAAEISRMLRPGGKAFLTANVEDAVPQVSINPENYTRFSCSGPLHIVRYERQHFLEVFDRAGLSLVDYAHHAAGNCQSDLYFVHGPTHGSNDKR